MAIVLAQCSLEAVLISNAFVAVVVCLLLLLIILGIVVSLVGIRNDLVKMKNGIDRSFAEIDLLLKQRHDELPKLLETCRPYMQQEQQALQSVVEARSAYSRAVSPSQKARADHLVSGALRTFLAAAKNPDLKRNTSFVQLRAQIAQLEGKVARQRDRYNEDVNSFNARIAQIPHAFVARLAKLRQRELFQASEPDS